MLVMFAATAAACSRFRTAAVRVSIGRSWSSGFYGASSRLFYVM